jgi:hypothetical protein
LKRIVDCQQQTRGACGCWTGDPLFVCAARHKMYVPATFGCTHVPWNAGVQLRPAWNAHECYGEGMYFLEGATSAGRDMPSLDIAVVPIRRYPWQPSAKQRRYPAQNPVLTLPHLAKVFQSPRRTVVSRCCSVTRPISLGAGFLLRLFCRSIPTTSYTRAVRPGRESSRRQHVRLIPRKHTTTSIPRRESL